MMTLPYRSADASKSVDTLVPSAEMMVETSRYWIERVDKLKGRDGWHILGVMAYFWRCLAIEPGPGPLHQ